MEKQALLDNVSIVLVDTRTPANIGAAARCMMNMGLSRLILVNPPADRKDDAVRLAAGADRILEEAAVYSSLKEAVAGHGLVIATSRHQGRLRKNVRSPREMTSRIMPLLDRNKAAIVFGNEINGLEMNHLALCQEIISIPSSAGFRALNLSHAVMIVAYELFIASQPAEISVRELAATDDLDGLYNQLESTLEMIGFLNPGNRRHMMFSFRQLIGRALPDARDVGILRGVLNNMGRIAKSGKK